ncbi:MAG: hypothetical protein KUG65_00930 [Sphingomonadaceae bacterium]|nr:hypothetical protein [Sphingomonadaceae bacterium]
MRAAHIASVLSLCAAAALSACGNRAGLEPKPGSSLPHAPYGREEPFDAEALLKPPEQSVPERNVELRRRSEERENDPFDLPPPE